jgi:hypothetical protein
MLAGSVHFLFRLVKEIPAENKKSRTFVIKTYAQQLNQYVFLDF